MDPDLEITSRIKDPSLKLLHPLHVDSWASLHVNMIIFTEVLNGLVGCDADSPGLAGVPLPLGALDIRLAPYRR